MVERIRRHGMMWANYVILFVDVLGQQKRLGPWIELLPPITKDCGDDLSSSTSAVISWRQLFHDFARDLPRAEADAPDLTLWPANEEAIEQEFIRSRSQRISSQQFGDTMILYARLENSVGVLNLRPLEMLLACASFAALSGLAAGVPLRGAINVGCATELAPGDLYGPGLAHAYHLEAKHARWPRVVVGSNVQRMLNEVLAWEHCSITESYLKSVAQRCNRRIFLAEDEFPTVEMIGENVMDFYGAPSAFLEYSHDAYKWACKERDRISADASLNSAERDKLLSRYDELIRYFSSRGLR